MSGSVGVILFLGFTFTVFPFLIGYLIGSLPFGLWIVKLLYKKDIRTIGSGNIGATNIWRAGYKKLAIMTFLFDAGKALIGYFLYLFCVMRFSEYYDIKTMGLISAIGSVIGHMYSIFLKFKGGKGISTWFGFLLVFDLRVFLLAALIWLILYKIWRYSSLSSICMILFSLSIFLYKIYKFKHSDNIEPSLIYLLVCILATITCLIIIYKHKDNIKRLMNGFETKL